MHTALFVSFQVTFLPIRWRCRRQPIRKPEAHQRNRDRKHSHRERELPAVPQAAEPLVHRHRANRGLAADALNLKFLGPRVDECNFYTFGRIRGEHINQCCADQANNEYGYARIINPFVQWQRPAIRRLRTKGRGRFCVGTHFRSALRCTYIFALNTIFGRKHRMPFACGQASALTRRLCSPRCLR